MAKQRLSNIEIIRIVAMLMIITHHVVLYGLGLQNAMMHYEANIGFSIIDCCSCGVNLFILISGFCGIKPSLRRGVQFYVTVLIYSFLCYIVYQSTREHFFEKDLFIQPFLFISNNTWWYITTYFYLFLLTPLINRGLNNMDNATLGKVVLLLTILSVYFGWYRQSKVNPDGYNVIHFVWMYCLGHYLRCTKDKWLNLPHLKIWSLIGWVSSAAIGVGLYAAHFGYPFAQNSINKALVSVFVFVFIYKLFDNQREIKWINTIAATTLGIYLLHESPYLRPHLIHLIGDNPHAYLIPLYTLTVFVGCGVIAYIIDILSKPLITRLGKWINC